MTTDATASSPPSALISYDAFAAVDVRVGVIRAAQPFPEARKPAYRLEIDFGPDLGVLKSSAQITAHYSCDALVGRQVVAVVNLGRKQIGKFVSDCLVLGVPDGAGGVILLQPSHAAPLGARMF